jgi:hypothetical protein
MAHQIMALQKRGSARAFNECWSSQEFGAPDESGEAFKVFGVRELHQLLKNRVHCLKVGFPLNHPIITTLDEIRDCYIKGVGIAAYFNQMVKATVASRQPQSQDEALDFTDTAQVQRMLKVRAYSIKMDLLVEDWVLMTFHQRRAEYIQAVGVHHYLAQMLGPLADVPAEHSTFFLMDQRQLPLDLAGDGQQPVRRFIQKFFRRRPFYLKVEVRRPDESHQVEVRYL